MSYQVLARKWRPKNFDKVQGQEHVLRALRNALTQERLHHAYLFSGTRGVGKTSIARILAKCLNCEKGVTDNPCGKCESCIEIDNGNSLDLIEVDAASRTKVEDTRDLLDNVQYLPTKGKYKIYIIDEVHMLSGHSFNALLKTLEEPPEHVKFLLATTDPQKLPTTVLSRCLQFNLKALSPELIKKQLEEILDSEKIDYEDQALLELAFSANGSVRDALSLLDQAISFGNNKITTTDIQTMLSSVDKKKVFSLLEALVSNDADTMLKIISDLAELATDFTSTLNVILEILHQITIIQLTPNTNTESLQHPEHICDLASKITPEETQLYYQIALIGKRDLALAPTNKLGFEMIMLRMLAFRPETTAPLEKKAKINEVKKNPTKPITKETNNLSDQELLKNIDVTGTTKALLEHCTIAKKNKVDSNRYEVEILLDPTQAPFLSKTHEERISHALSKLLNSPTIANIKLGSPNIDTPAKIKKSQDLENKNKALQSIKKDPKIKELVSKFGAKIITDSVKNNNS